MTFLDWLVAADPGAAKLAEQLQCQKECGERPGGHRWHLEIDCGRALVSCVDCKADPQPDYEDAVAMEPIPVSLTYRTAHNHTPAGDYCCDCDFWIDVQITPGGEAK